MGSVPLKLAEKVTLPPTYLAAELGVSGAATFEGRIPRQTDAYQAGHLVALTSVSEGFPYTVVE